MPIPRQIRHFNKHILNRLTSRFADLRFGPFAVIHHVGRRSGKPYATAIMVEPTADGFVIALTYGTAIDWYRNILVTDHSTLHWHGRDYVLGRPEPMTVEAALLAYPRFFRRLLRLFGVQSFVSLKQRES